MYPFTQEPERAPLVGDTSKGHKQTFFTFRGKYYSFNPRYIFGLLAMCASVAGMLLTYGGLPATSKTVRLLAETSEPRPYYVTDITAQKVCGSSYAETGYINIPATSDDYYFYYFIGATENADTAPLVVWLTGGPGCSSMIALFAENGPCYINEKLKTYDNPYGWNRAANMLYIDQPSHVGFSFAADTEYELDEASVEDHLYQFMQTFYKIHPEFIGRKLFITGESYSGHYVPPLAAYILHKNTHVSPTNKLIKIPLEGIAIGNGLTNPKIQFQHYVDMVNNSYGIPLLSNDQIETMKKAQVSCAYHIDQCNKNKNSDECDKALDSCLVDVPSPYGKSGRNPYNILEKCNKEHAIDCVNLDAVARFLNSEDTLTKLNIDRKHSEKWEQCNDDVNAALIYDAIISYSDRVSFLLNAGIRVLIYVGDADLVCNYQGNEAWTLALDWKGTVGYNKAPVVPYKLDNKDFGTIRTYGDLTFIRVFDAGHMVPKDQPRFALDMITRFLEDELSTNH